MDCSTHEKHEIKFPTNKNDFTVGWINMYKLYAHRDLAFNKTLFYCTLVHVHKCKNTNIFFYFSCLFS